MKSKVCHLSTVHHCGDPRIYYKECRSLMEMELDVVLIIKCNDSESLSYIRNLTLVKLNKYKNRIVRIIKGLPVAMYHTFKSGAKIVHIHDPELIPIGIILKLFKRVVIFDMHELVWEQIEYKEWLYNNLFKSIARRVYYIFEYPTIRFFDGIVLAEDEYIKSFLEKYKRYEKKFYIIRNLPVLSDIEKANPHIREYDHPYVIYAGAITSPRGIKEMIYAIEMLRWKVELYLLGRWENEMLYRECQELQGWKYVRYIGWVNPAEMYGYMKSAIAGICVLHPVRNYMISLPTKVFEYMACSLPVIISDFPIYKDIFANCAYFTNPLDPKDIAKNISMVIDDKKQAQEKAEAGKKLVANKYNWEFEKERIRKLYEEMLK